ncbi:vacuolar protein sorting-associated protein 4-like isoform X2 [Armigeres subalbatus]|uniref:vacuolar protein sorting-associated protein 4-like isoform X2 n=1 Tax=Armigeres subalbatus TaxID=124917 RepID=UPI002ED021A1
MDGKNSQKNSQESISMDHGLDNSANKFKSILEDFIIVRDHNFKLSDVAGLQDAKKVLKEALLKETRISWNGVLLYGPPGTGKTYLAKAIASEAPSSTFFSVSSSDLVSTWLSMSQQLMMHLFEMARAQKPSIVFIDDVDLLCSEKLNTENVRRLKSEFISQMQNSGIGQGDGVLVLAATNNPWSLDSDLLGCFQKRIHISLPDEYARRAMFRLHLQNTTHYYSEENISSFAVKTQGYTGADIILVVRDALMQPVRNVQSSTHFKKIKSPKCCSDSFVPCCANDAEAIKMTWLQISNEQLVVPPVTMSIDKTKPSITQTYLEKIIQFSKDFGQEDELRK